MKEDNKSIIKYIQCAYCKADNIRFSTVKFNKPEKLSEQNGIEFYSSFGCDNCRNYFDRNKEKK